MNWDAPRFTIDYSQPAAYRFSLDSVLLAKAVARDYRDVTLAPQFRVLDVCAGCGVVGMELHCHRPEFQRIDFNEIQDIYRPHFQKNLESLNLKKSTLLQAEWLPINYAELDQPKFRESYDLIVANPPYFEKDQGLIPPDDFKARCRFFLDSDFRTLWNSALAVLKPGGLAYVLVREQADHGRKRQQQVVEQIKNRAELLNIEDLRGTFLYKVKKL